VLIVVLSRYRLPKLYAAAIAFIIFLIYMSIGIYFVSDYFTGDGFNDAVLFHIRYGLSGAGYGEFLWMMLLSIGFFSFGIVLYLLYCKYRSVYKGCINETLNFQSFFVVGELTDFFYTTLAIKSYIFVGNKS